MVSKTVKPKSPFQSFDPSWVGTSPPRDTLHFDFTEGFRSYRREAFHSPCHSPLSSSLSPNFLYMPPTSPLARSQSNYDVDLSSPFNSINIQNSPCSTRRHTLNHTQSSFVNLSSSVQTPILRERTFPYQAHQPRRSLNSTPVFSSSGSDFQTPSFSHLRRPSLSAEHSPLQHASMVGSFEESILRGRMSTSPSKPIEFLAQIGVLGLGKCKQSLRCPPHVTLPFSAVFYSYGGTSSSSSKVDEGPSPYVGQIDLENGLPNPDEEQRLKRKLQSRIQDRKGLASDEAQVNDSQAEASEVDISSKPKIKRRSRSPKAPPGGCYRIPEKGQLQIVIKNQNKTAVKLFLVPYDLTGMEPGTKTFIRQRSYSAGPILDPDMPESAKNAAMAAAVERPTLRYLIHLHICCTSRGRFYLYKSIRVVFANRVPDGKEKLRNELTYPDPRFTPYKPMRVMHPPSNMASSNQIHDNSSFGSEQTLRHHSVGNLHTTLVHPALHRHPLHNHLHHHHHHVHHQQREQKQDQDSPSLTSLSSGEGSFPIMDPFVRTTTAIKPSNSGGNVMGSEGLLSQQLREFSALRQQQQQQQQQQQHHGEQQQSNSPSLR
jgi:hypothetical protein